MPDPTTNRTAAEGLQVHLDLSFPAQVEAIAPIVERITQIARQQNFPEDKEAEIGLAVQEALVNACKYGCGYDASKSVHCWVGSGRGGLLIVVRDPGPGFDPSALPNPQEGEHIFRDHGRGIFLIRQLMDEVRFERGGTELRMRKDHKT